jgi:folate-binding protein YgfZ
MADSLPPHDVAAEYHAAREAAALFDLSSRGKVEVAGPEAARFLHNLCTNDILHLPVGAGCEAFFTTAKAKVVAHSLISHLAQDKGDTFLLDVAPGQAATLLHHLDHYLISEQVVFTDRTAALALLHLAGPGALAHLKYVSGDFPELQPLHHATLPTTTGLLRRHDALSTTGFDLLLPTDEAQAVRHRLVEAGARLAGPETYDILRVEAGTPAFGPDIDENRLVMEVGRTAQAICYTKGCFLGQEPIVMARDRGHVNRTLLGLKLHGSGPAPRGAKLVRDGNDVGQVASSVVSPRLGPIALAYLRRGSQEPGTVVEVQGEGAPRTAAVSSLPFGGSTGGGV